MDLKTIVVTLVILLVFGLVFYRIWDNEIKSIGEPCGEEETCVRFCCYEKSHCENEKIFKSIPENKTEKLNENFRVLKGIECDGESEIYLIQKRFYL